MFRSVVRVPTKAVSAQAVRMMSAEPYGMIKSEIIGKVGVITLNRPKALNALCNQLIAEVVDSCQKFDKNNDVGAIVITGSEKAFAAGADIKEMSTLSYKDCYSGNLFVSFMDIAKVSKPVSIASFTFLVSDFFVDHCCCVWLCSGWWM